MSTMRTTLRVIAAAAALVLLGALPASPAAAVTLPDHRAYELVTRFEKDGHEADLNGVQGGYGYTSRDGNTLEWRAIGGCCGAHSAAQETYQSFRSPAGSSSLLRPRAPRSARPRGRRAAKSPRSRAACTTSKASSPSRSVCSS